MRTKLFLFTVILGCTAYGQASVSADSSAVQTTLSAVDSLDEVKEKIEVNAAEKQSIAAKATASKADSSSASIVTEATDSVESVTKAVEAKVDSAVANVKDEQGTIAVEKDTLNTKAKTPAATPNTDTEVLKPLTESVEAKSEVDQKKRWLGFKEGWSIGLNTYQIAPGLSIAKTLYQDRLHLRLGANQIAGALPEAALSSVLESDTTLLGGGNLSVGRAYLALDYQIAGVFSLTAGAQLNDLSSQLVFARKSDYIITGTVDNGGVPLEAQVTVPKELIGNIRINLESAKVAPFAGFALGRAVPKKRVGFRFEAGVVFQGAMKLVLEEKLIDTGVQGADGENITFLIGEAENPADTEEISRDILDDLQAVNDELAKYPVLPYISLSLNIRL